MAFVWNYFSTNVDAPVTSSFILDSPSTLLDSQSGIEANLLTPSLVSSLKDISYVSYDSVTVDKFVHTAYGSVQYPSQDVAEQIPIYQVYDTSSDNFNLVNNVKLSSLPGYVQLSPSKNWIAVALVNSGVATVNLYAGSSSNPLINPDKVIQIGDGLHATFYQRKKLELLTSSSLAEYYPSFINGFNIGAWSADGKYLFYGYTSKNIITNGVGSYRIGIIDADSGFILSEVDVPASTPDTEYEYVAAYHGAKIVKNGTFYYVLFSLYAKNFLQFTSSVINSMQLFRFGSNVLTKVTEIVLPNPCIAYDTSANFNTLYLGISLSSLSGDPNLLQFHRNPVNITLPNFDHEFRVYTLNKRTGLYTLTNSDKINATITSLKLSPTGRNLAMITLPQFGGPVGDTSLGMLKIYRVVNSNSLTLKNSYHASPLANNLTWVAGVLKDNLFVGGQPTDLYKNFQLYSIPY